MIAFVVSEESGEGREGKTAPPESRATIQAEPRLE
jgi:hypothetical protein